jgi:hypothetical protein
MRQIECAMRMSMVATACGLLLAGCGGGGGSGNSEGRLQTINFQYPGGNTLLNGPTVLHATATSGLPVTFTSGTPNTCTVSGDQLTLVAAGECLVIANQGGGSAANGVQWAAADRVSQLFNVLRHAQAAVLPMAAVFRGTSETVALSAVTDAGLAASYTSNSPAVCTVSGTVLTVTGLGLCDLTVTAPADTNYAALATGVSIPVDSLPVHGCGSARSACHRRHRRAGPELYLDHADGMYGVRQRLAVARQGQLPSFSDQRGRLVSRVFNFD